MSSALRKFSEAEYLAGEETRPVKREYVDGFVCPLHAQAGASSRHGKIAMNLAFDGYGLHRVAAQLDPRNVVSARMCERLGMQKEAHQRQNWWCKGEWTDTAIYAMLKSDRL